MTEQEITKLTEKLDLIHTDVTEIKVTLKGYDGIPGLCSEFAVLKKDFHNFRRMALIVGAFLLGAGLLGSGIVELIKYL